MDENKIINFSLYKSTDTIPNRRNVLEIIYVLRGPGTISLDVNYAVYSIKSNDIFVMNPLELHHILLEDHAVLLSLTISNDFAVTLFPELETRTIDCRSFLYSESQQDTFDIIRIKFSRIFNAYNKQGYELQTSIRLYLAEIIADLVEYYSINKEKSIMHKNGQDGLLKVIDYMHYHYEENITLKAMSEKTFLSMTYLSHLFKKQMHTTFTQYLNTIRLQHAVTLLKRDITITELSEQVGFASTNAFIKTFKKHYGMTPGQYKSELPSEVKLGKHNRIVDEEKESNILSTLMSYSSLDKSDLHQGKKSVLIRVNIHLNDKGKILNHNWKYCMNGGYAKDLLSGNVQTCLRLAQKEI